MYNNVIVYNYQSSLDIIVLDPSNELLTKDYIADNSAKYMSSKESFRDCFVGLCTLEDLSNKPVGSIGLVYGADLTVDGVQDDFGGTSSTDETTAVKPLTDDITAVEAPLLAAEEPTVNNLCDSNVSELLQEDITTSYLPNGTPLHIYKVEQISNPGWFTTTIQNVPTPVGNILYLQKPNELYNELHNELTLADKKLCSLINELAHSEEERDHLLSANRSLHAKTQPPVCIYSSIEQITDVVELRKIRSAVDKQLSQQEPRPTVQPKHFARKPNNQYILFSDDTIEELKHFDKKQLKTKQERDHIMLKRRIKNEERKQRIKLDRNRKLTE